MLKISKLLLNDYLHFDYMGVQIDSVNNNILNFISNYSWACYYNRKHNYTLYLYIQYEGYQRRHTL